MTAVTMTTQTVTKIGTDAIRSTSYSVRTSCARVDAGVGNQWTLSSTARSAAVGGDPGGDHRYHRPPAHPQLDAGLIRRRM